MSLRLHILLGSLLFVAIIGALALFTRGQEQELGTLATDVYDNALVGVTNVQKAQMDFVRLTVAGNNALSRDSIQSLLDQLDVARDRAISSAGKQLAGDIRAEIVRLLKPMPAAERAALMQRIDDDLSTLVAKYSADSFIYRVRTDRIIAAMNTGFLIAVGAATLLALLAAFALGQFIVPPISRAVQIAASIAGGNLENHIAPSMGRSETSRLLSALSVMQDSIAESVRRAEALRVSEAARLAAEFETHSAHRANQSKSEFLATMSHELRTPLNAILGFSEVIKEQMMGELSPRYVGYARDIHASGTHLLALINDVLDLSKLEAGRLELRDGTVDLPAICESCLTLVRRQAANGDVALVEKGIAELPLVNADDRLLRQILLNLLSNAIKFTPAGGDVRVEGHVDAQGVRLSVSDTGIGMSKEELAIALSPFGQVDSKIARQHKGTGLGLPIARSLAQLHGGDLLLASTPGEGTTVTLQLPASRILSPARTRASA